MPPRSVDARPSASALLTAGNLLAGGAVVAPSLAVLVPLALAPLLTLLAAALLASDWRQYRAILHRFSPLAALLALLSLWAGVTAAWSPIPGHSLFEAARFLLISALGLFVLGAGVALSTTEADRLGRAAIAGVALAVLLLQIERWSGGAVLRLLHQRPLDPAMLIYRYDRGVTFLGLAAWPAAAALAARHRMSTLLVGVIGVAFTLVLFRSTSTILAGVTGVGTALIAWRVPRAAASLMVGTALVMVLVFPLIAPSGPIIEQIRQEAPRLKPSAIHRLIIWRFVADRIADRPLLGWGMDASRAIPGGEAHARDVMPEVKLPGNATMLPLHPHDAALQWRLELGLPGALLCVASVGLVLWRVAWSPSTPRPQRALALGCAAAVLTVAMLSFGAWQAWWLSSVWLVGAFLAGVQPRPVSS